MISWYWLIVSACGGIVFAKICEEVFEWDNILTEFIAFLTLIVAFVPCVVWHMFFKLTIDPIPEDRMNKAGIVPKMRVGNLCLCFDKKAKHIWNKMFFLRVKKNTIDK